MNKKKNKNKNKHLIIKILKILKFIFPFIIFNNN